MTLALHPQLLLTRISPWLSSLRLVYAADRSHDTRAVRRVCQRLELDERELYLLDCTQEAISWASVQLLQGGMKELLEYYGYTPAPSREEQYEQYIEAAERLYPRQSPLRARYQLLTGYEAGPFRCWTLAAELPEETLGLGRP